MSEMTNSEVPGSSPTTRLRSVRAVVTGAGQGIGLAIARRLVAEDASVSILDVDKDAARAAAQDLNAHAVIADVRSSDEVNEAFANVARTSGGIDVLVNNAGLVRDRRLEEMTDEDWDLVLGVCLRGAFVCSRAALPYLRESGRGRIINISSRAYLGNPGQANYSSAKAGIIGLTRALSLELGRDAITVNAVAPGMIDTELLRKHPKADAIIERAVKGTPVGRLGQAEDVAGAVSFLASDDSSYISGDVIHVAGGRW